jgi:hypothetical protein
LAFLAAQVGSMDFPWGFHGMKWKIIGIKRACSSGPYHSLVYWRVTKKKRIDKERRDWL